MQEQCKLRHTGSIRVGVLPLGAPSLAHGCSWDAWEMFPQLLPHRPISANEKKMAAQEPDGPLGAVCRKPWARFLLSRLLANGHWEIMLSFDPLVSSLRETRVTERVAKDSSLLASPQASGVLSQVMPPFSGLVWGKGAWFKCSVERPGILDMQWTFPFIAPVETMGQVRIEPLVPACQACRVSWLEIDHLTLANTKWCKNPEKLFKPWQMGTHLRVLS